MQNVLSGAGSPVETPPMLLTRIGSTTYVVSVHFSNTSKETLNDKTLRLIRNEVQNVK